MGSGSFVICEYDSVKKFFPEFKSVMQSLEAKLIADANAAWAPLTYGGFAPSAGQYGRTTILPPLFRDINNLTLSTWTQTFSAAQTGAQTVMSGVNNGLIPEDYKVGLVGLAFPEELRITEIRMQIGDRKYPRINIEEAMAYEKPAIIFEDGFILNEEEGFDLYGYVECAGRQRIVPLGFQLNRIPNKTQITNTGASL